MPTLNQSACSELENIQDKEWLIANGIGGYASSTVAGLNTWRYHDLPVAATTPPAGRHLIPPKFHDTLVVSGNTSAFGLKTQFF